MRRRRPGFVSFGAFPGSSAARSMGLLLERASISPGSFVFWDSPGPRSASEAVCGLDRLSIAAFEYPTERAIREVPPHEGWFSGLRRSLAQVSGRSASQSGDRQRHRRRHRPTALGRRSLRAPLAPRSSENARICRRRRRRRAIGPGFLLAISAGIGQRFNSTGISTPAQKHFPRTGSCRVHAQRGAPPAMPPPTVGETRWRLFGFAVGAANRAVTEIDSGKFGSF